MAEVNFKRKWGLLIAGVCVPLLMFFQYATPDKHEHLPPRLEPEKTHRKPKSVPVPPGASAPQKEEIANPEQIEPTAPPLKVSEVKQFTDEELKSWEMRVINPDGTINPEFFSKFGFTAEQEAAFRKVWADRLDLLQRIESYKIEEEASEPGTKKFWIKEFVVEGAALHDDTANMLEGKIPEQAGRYFLELNDQDVRYTFSNFGKYRRRFELTRTDDGFEMVENFYSTPDEDFENVTDKGLSLVGSRKHRFQAPSLRFQRLLTDKP